MSSVRTNESVAAESYTGTRFNLVSHDIFLIVVMGTLAACGLVYQYLLSHYAGRILGSVESTIFAMIGLMIVAMGAGAFSAKFVKQPFSAFTWLEASVALVGASSVIVISTAMGLLAVFPRVLEETFGLPYDLSPNGGWISSVKTMASLLPYFSGLVMGFMIGMEIPLIARVRQSLHPVYLQHNVGTLYGADYLGAGIGAALWVGVMLRLDVSTSATLTASVNLLAGLLFLFVYWKKIARPVILLLFHGLVSLLVVWIALSGKDWAQQMSNLLYQDEVVYSLDTRYQHISLTRRNVNIGGQPIYNLYLNGRLQFSSNDEYIYHSMLVVPALAASARREKVLIIGGGDGLALRDVLAHDPKQVTVIDLDGELVSLFTSRRIIPGREAAISFPEAARSYLLGLNRDSFADQRVELVVGDAFVEVDNLLKQQRHYDAIIVDLPDPSHPNLNKLYSTFFYNRLRLLLAADGAITIQSTSPYHARKAFISIVKTLKAAGFAHVEHYHSNVPSFGEWGWTIGTVRGAPASTRITEYGGLEEPFGWLTKPFLLGAFQFPHGFFGGSKSININELGSNQLYLYHQQAWSGRQGLLDFGPFGSENPEN